MTRMAMVCLTLLAMTITGCDEAPLPPSPSNEGNYGVVRVCLDGTWVYRDQRNGRLYLNHPPGYVGSAPVAPGVDLETICGSHLRLSDNPGSEKVPTPLATSTT